MMHDGHRQIHPQTEAGINVLISWANQQPDKQIKFFDSTGRCVGIFSVPQEASVRPSLAPRHLRPKRPLSKRQRDRVKRERMKTAQ